MIRAQILLDEDQHQYLKQTSSETGESISALVRSAIRTMQALRDRNQERQAVLDLIGAFEGDQSDVSVRHDHYLNEPRP